MPLVVPLVLLGGGLASLGYGLFAGKDSTPSTPSNGQGVDTPKRGTPPELAAAAQALIANGKDPAVMLQMATLMDSYGYTDIANALRTRAADLSAPLPDFPIPPIPNVPSIPNVPIPPTPTPPAPVPVPDIVPPTPTPDAVITARVTASDGLNTRVSPSTSAALVNPNDAWAGKTVTVLDWNAAPASTGVPSGWAKIKTPGGAVGYASKQFLSLNGPAPSVSGIGAEIVGTRPARCVAPSGCRLRMQPTATSNHSTIVGNGQQVTIMKQVPGSKAERRSPGPGGWSLVRYGKAIGWLPSEWLV